MFKKVLPTFALLLLVSPLCQYGENAEATSSQCFQGASAGYVRPRLTVGITGRSLAKNNINIHNQPDINSKITGYLSPSNSFKVVEGPECTNSYVWWKVNNAQVTGWVAEADPVTFNYWLEPILDRSVADAEPNDPNNTLEKGWSLWRRWGEINNSGLDFGFSNMELGSIMEFENSCFGEVDTPYTQKKKSESYWYRVSDRLNQTNEGDIQIGCWEHGRFKQTITLSAIREKQH